MKPRKVYETARATLWLGDCRDVDVSTGSCGLMATDPPYGVEWKSSFAKHAKHERIAGDDGSIEVPTLLGLLVRAVMRHRHVYVFGYRPDDLAEPMKLGGASELIWDKGQPGLGDLSLPWGPQHEPITFGVFCSSPANRKSNVGALAARLRRGSVLSVPRTNSTSARRHPTEKPIALMRQLIESSSLLGDIVYDPFAGVGSTLVAAVLAGRRAIGVELDEGYCNLAIERLAKAERVVDAMEAC